MFEDIYKPVAAITDGMVVRRAGLFYRQRIKVSDIERVVAVVKDAVTHEEIAVGFFDKKNDRVWLSEVDKDFSNVMNSLATMLPGFISPDGLFGEKPFDKAQRVLWEKSAH